MNRGRRPDSQAARPHFPSTIGIRKVPQPGCDVPVPSGVGIPGPPRSIPGWPAQRQAGEARPLIGIRTFLARFSARHLELSVLGVMVVGEDNSTPAGVRHRHRPLVRTRPRQARRWPPLPPSGGQDAALQARPAPDVSGPPWRGRPSTRAAHLQRVYDYVSQVRAAAASVRLTVPGIDASDPARPSAGSSTPVRCAATAVPTIPTAR